ncbi:hypothetical protein F66182_11507, partial [Fusarium sp. NRRL 66182]
MGATQNGTTLNGKTHESTQSAAGKKEKPRQGYFRWSLALAV